MEPGGGSKLDELRYSLMSKKTSNENLKKLSTMLRKFFIVVVTIVLFPCYRLMGQTPIVIVESTLKIASLKEEVFYYGFAAGDKLIFNFEETNNKELKEIEITEMPSSVKFTEQKAKKIENKTFEIYNTGIYKFRFTNGILPRTFKFSIQRIPADASTQNFNTTVYTRTVDDTLYTTADENYIDRTDTVVTNFQDRTVKLSPFAEGATYRSTFNFVLPENTISWSYYIYMNDAGKNIYTDAAKKISENPVKPKFANYTPLAAEAFGGDSYLKKLPEGNQVNYWVVEGNNAELFMTGAQFRFIKKGTITNDFSRMDRKGVLYFCFSNMNVKEPVNITVKITSLHINEVLRTRQVRKIVSIRPKTEMYLKN